MWASTSVLLHVQLQLHFCTYLPVLAHTSACVQDLHELHSLIGLPSILAQEQKALWDRYSRTHPPTAYTSLPHGSEAWLLGSWRLPVLRHNAFNHIPGYFKYSEDFPLLEYFKYSGNIIGKYIHCQEDLILHEQVLNRVLWRTGTEQSAQQTRSDRTWSNAHKLLGYYQVLRH